MKLKQQPEDFQVEELTDVTPADHGPQAFYRLEKRGWSTPDALAAVRRRWRLEPRRLSCGGLKDRHALTVQYLTVRHGPRRNLTHQGITVTYLGQLSEPYTSARIRANRFRVTLRDLDAGALAGAERALEEVRVEGVPNYFDDQRFGSVTPGGEFIARLLVLGRFEDALRLALTGPYEHDRAAARREKATLRAHWGDWAACRELRPGGHARRLVDHLVHHPGDYRGAAVRLPPELRSLYLSAYQSHLWNRLLARWLREHCRPEQLVPVDLRLGTVPFWRGLDETQRLALRQLLMPLPSARTRLEDGDPRALLLEAVVAEEGLAPSQLKVKGVRELFFSKGERAALCLPEGLGAEAGPDELHPRRQRLLLQFDLPRGCYATLVVKRLTTPG